MDFSYTSSLYDAFKRWLSTVDKTKQCCSENAFRKILTKKYHNIFYVKKRTVLDNGKPKDARGFCGISIKDSELNQFIADSNSKQDVSSTERKEKFTTYMNNIISTYFIDNL